MVGRSEEGGGEFEREVIVVEDEVLKREVEIGWIVLVEVEEGGDFVYILGGWEEDGFSEGGRFEVWSIIGYCSCDCMFWVGIGRE